MFRNLIAELADEFRLIAPDHIGFGHSAVPTVDEFECSFDRLAEVTEFLLNRLGLDRFALYIQDYGALIGLRIALEHPERVTALITQRQRLPGGPRSPKVQPRRSTAQSTATSTTRSRSSPRVIHRAIAHVAARTPTATHPVPVNPPPSCCRTAAT